MHRKVDSQSADLTIADLASAQYGVVTRAQLGAAGLGEGALAYRVRLGRLHRLYRGVFSVGHTNLSRDGRLLAGVFACGPGAAASHRSAGDHLGIRPTTSALIEVTVPSQAGRLARPGVKIHRSRSLPPTEITVERGIRVTTPSRTLLDLAGALPPAQLERAIDRAESLRIFDLRTLDAVMRAHPARPGTRALRDILDRYTDTAITRSELEERFLELCFEQGVPRPLVNARVGPYEADFLWPERRLIAETDGHAHHGTRAAFERDRARDTHLQTLGYRVVRFTYRQVIREPVVVTSALRSLLGDGGKR